MFGYVFMKTYDIAQDRDNAELKAKLRLLPISARYAAAMHRYRIPIGLAWLSLGVSLLMGIIFVIDPSWQHFLEFLLFAVIGMHTLYRNGVQFILGLSQQEMDDLKIKREAEHPGTGQPATRPVDEPEGGDKAQPEAEGRSR